MSGILAAMIGAGGSVRNAEFIGVTVLQGTGNGAAELPAGTQVGDLVMVFTGHGTPSISGGGTGSWSVQSYLDAHNYQKTFGQKVLASLSSVVVSGLNYGPTIVAVYRNATFAAVISKPENGTTVLPLVDTVGRLAKSGGYVSVYHDRSGDGSGTVPSGWTKRTGPNSSNAVFTGELADLPASQIPASYYAASWTGISSTSSYFQSGWFLHLTKYANQTEYDAARTAADALRSDVSLFARMTTQPDSTRKALISSTINDLKTAGIWTKLDAFYVMAAHTDQAGRLNWIKPGFDLINYVVAPTFTADRGMATNGTDQALDTGFTPSTHAVRMTQNSATMFVRHRTNTQNSYYDAGWSFTSNPAILIGTRNGADKLTYAVNAGVTTSTATITDARKVIAVNRSASNTQAIYVDGSLFESASVTSVGMVLDGPLKIGASLSNRFSARQFAVFGFGASLTATEHTALRNIIEAYLTAVGA